MTETSFESLVKEIGEAIKLDDDNNDKEAYKKYVVSIYKIATNLVLTLNQAGGDVIVDKKTSKQVKLVAQCVDRVSVLIEKMDKPKVKQTKNAIVNTVKAIIKGPSVASPYPAQKVTSSGYLSTLAPSLPPENNPHVYRVQKAPTLTPMEIAHRQNQSLMAAYKARMNRLNHSDFNAFSYSLTIQRKLAENIAIARVQEEELARKMQARNQRFEEEAAKRFATPIGMSKAEQEQRQIYRRILEYENDAASHSTFPSKKPVKDNRKKACQELLSRVQASQQQIHVWTQQSYRNSANFAGTLAIKWLKNWRSKLEINPEDPILISQLVAEVLRCADHPLTELLVKYQTKIYERLYPLVNNKHDVLDKIRIPLAKNIWPSLKEVADIVPKRQQSPEIQKPDQKNHSLKINVVDEDLSDENNDFVDCRTDNMRDLSDSSSRSCDQSVHEGKNEGEWEDPLCVRSASSDSLKSIEKHNNKAKDSVAGPKSILPPPSDVANDEADGISVNSDKLSEGSQSLTSDTGGRSKLESAVSETNENLDMALRKGQDLIDQLSWERKQAQLLMRQVTRDYSSYKTDDYDEDNLDYLFEEEDKSEDSGILWQPFWENLTSQTDVSPAAIREKGEQAKCVQLDRSVSHPVTGSAAVVEDPSGLCHSLPASFDEPDGGKDDKFSQMHLEAYKRHLQSISEDIHRYLEKLLVLMTIAYEPLDTPVGRDQCSVSLEEPFFKPIWKPLLRLFRVVYYKQELVLACVMTKYANITPEDMKVSKKLCLIDSLSGATPYQAAITELSHVPDYYTMLTKLECVVKVCRMICECVDDHYKKTQGGDAGKRKTPSLGADDLLPILSYVVVRSGLPQLIAECQAMTEFIHEGYMMGEEGYCLTTLRTALNFIISLYPPCLKS